MYLCSMIYPKNFESKIGFDEIRRLLKGLCLSTLGQEKVDEIAFSDEASVINEHLEQIREFRRMLQNTEKPEFNFFFDVRESVARIRLENTHLEEEELWDLRRSLETIGKIVVFLNHTEDSEREGVEPRYTYPALHRLAENVLTFPAMIRRIDSILDKFGHIKDSASMVLAGIRHDMEQTAGSISRTLYTILHAAQREGLVAQDVAPTLRDGRLMIPVAPGLKRKINGIVHDESATGKTVFIEPAEVVEANNKVRELEAAERREIVRILTVFSDELRPHVQEVLDSYRFLAQIDLIQAKANMAEQMQAFEPETKDEPMMDWIRAIHPLLQRSLAKQEKKVVPLDIRLEKTNDTEIKGATNAGSDKDKKNIGRLLIISGPNAGGKSVCLKTVGLLQYMLQCGLSIPIGDRSTTGIFHDIMIDIGDEQSIADDLSTYSSHLLNMKNMMRQANERTLLLIDEFGGGTEPTIGGAIAEAVLKQFWKKEAFGVITTHYQNLKHFADSHEGIANGAMLYDRKEMQALFQLQIGQPGSSFAIEIARKIGLPEEVIRDASDIVGSDYIQSDKYLQDIVRDKRYWEAKRQNIHQHEKKMQQTIERYESEVQEVEKQRREILRRAKEQAEELLRESNKRIENAIREIRESQAEKEAAKRIREELKAFNQQLDEVDTAANDEMIAKKIRQIQERKERREKRKREKAEKQGKPAAVSSGSAAGNPPPATLQAGDTVRIKGLTSVGKIESVDGKMATVIFGDMRTKMRLERLERAEEQKKKADTRTFASVGRQTREAIDDRKLNFKQDLDVRGMRGDEAINAVTYFIDDAILLGISQVRILHGTGSGILRQLIRQYLSTVPNIVNYRDEHVQFGGAGITVAELD